MGEKPETKVVRDIVKKLKANRRWDGFKVYGNMMQRAGEPDLDGSLWSSRLHEAGRPDVLCWIHCKFEVKQGDNVATPLQLHRIEVYKDRGYCAGVIYGYEDACALIAEYEDVLLEGRVI